MSLTAGIIARQAGTNRIQAVTPAAVIFFNGGTPVDSRGFIVSEASVVPTVFKGGLGYSAAGGLCTQVLGTIASYVSGLPLDASGRLCISTGAITGYNAGLPVDTNGRVVMNAPVAP